MNSTELCAKLKITAKELPAHVAAGLPRAKVKGKWVYDEREIARWILAEARKKRVGSGQSAIGSREDQATADSLPPAKTEIIARTVPECLHTMAELGYPKSDRVFRTWMTEPGFPGTPGNKGKQDGEFPVYAILKWAGEIGEAVGSGQSAVSKGPKEEIWATRAEREKLELEAYKKNLIERNVTEATQLRIFGIVASAFEALPDELTAAIPEKQKAQARADLETRLRVTLQVIADELEGDEEEELATDEHG